MKASVDGRVVAESEDIVACRGYEYFPPAAVRIDWLEKAEKTERDSSVRTACNSTMSSSRASATSARPGHTRRRGRKWHRWLVASASGKTSR